jgi:hypothetical protein
MQNVQRPRVKRQCKSDLTLEEARAIVEACRTEIDKMVAKVRKAKKGKAGSQQSPLGQMA